jgi:hypothetical protein
MITTRFPLTDLIDWQGHGYQTRVIGRLPPKAARALLRARGVEGSDTELDQLSKDFGYHPLTLTLLGGLLLHFLDGNPKRIDELPPPTQGSGLAELDEQAQRLVRVLARYEQDLTPEEVIILKAVSSFRLPIDADAIIGTFLATAKFHDQAPSSSLRMEQSLSRLTELQLLEISRQDGSRRYSAHPVISQYFYQALKEDALLLHLGASEYLERKLGVGDFRVRTRARVRTRGAELGWGRDEWPSDPVTLDMFEELIYHMLQSGRFDAACDLYFSILGGFTHVGMRLGDYARGVRITALLLASPRKKNSGILNVLRDDHERFIAGCNPGVEVKHGH